MYTTQFKINTLSYHTRLVHNRVELSFNENNECIINRYYRDSDGRTDKVRALDFLTDLQTLEVYSLGVPEYPNGFMGDVVYPMYQYINNELVQVGKIIVN